jgi:hypothetical protein
VTGSQSQAEQRFCVVADELCCFSPASVQHLKSRHGQGYMLEINVKETSTKKVINFMRKAYPMSRLDEVHAGRMRYHLPQQGVSLSSVFSAMEANKKPLDVFDYSLSQTSLGQVMLQLLAESVQCCVPRLLTSFPCVLSFAAPSRAESIFVETVAQSLEHHGGMASPRAPGTVGRRVLDE